MKRNFALLSLMILVGCLTPPAATKTEEPAVTVKLPAQFGARGAKLTRVNAEHRFVVISFAGRAMPAVGTKVSVYRNGQRVGSVQITEPVRASFATADILEGELQVGDEAR